MGTWTYTLEEPITYTHLEWTHQQTSDNPRHTRSGIDLPCVGTQTAGEQLLSERKPTHGDCAALPHLIVRDLRIEASQVTSEKQGILFLTQRRRRLWSLDDLDRGDANMARELHLVMSERCETRVALYETSK
jgi:hypothetical protein